MEKIKKIYSRYKLLIWPVFSGLASIIILALVVIPQLLAYLNVNGQITDLRKRSGNLEVKAQGLENFDVKAAQHDLQAVLTILPTDREVPQAFLMLQDFISRSGLILKGTAYNSSSKASSKESFQLSITVSGQLDALRNFLIGLQDAGRLFQVEAIDVQFQKSGSLVEAEIPLTVFYGTTPKSVGSVDEEIPKLDGKEEKLIQRLSQLAETNKARWSAGEASASSVPQGKANPFE